MVKPSRRGPMVERLVSERRVCRVLLIPRATYRYRSCLDPRTELRMRIREALAIDAGQSLKRDDLVRTLNGLKSSRGVPKVLFCDNGSEFTSQAMNLWAYRNGVKIYFSRPGKPTGNAFVESFNGTFRPECLNIHWFIDLKEARRLIEAWRRKYNEGRPHASLDDRTPSDFASPFFGFFPTAMGFTSTPWRWARALREVIGASRSRPRHETASAVRIAPLGRLTTAAEQYRVPTVQRPSRLTPCRTLRPPNAGGRPPQECHPGVG